MRVLVVEDEKDIRDLEVELIESFGHEPFSAVDVESGLEKLAAVKPDVVLLDLLLKGALSIPFIKATRELMRAKPPRIIIVSALHKAANVAESNGVEFLKKPFDIDELQAVIEGTCGSLCRQSENSVPKDADVSHASRLSRRAARDGGSNRDQA